VNPAKKLIPPPCEPQFRTSLHRSLRSRAWWVAGVYALFATLWILFSDRALNALMPTPDLLVKASLYKGLGFVIVTSLLLAILMRRAFGALEDANLALKLREEKRREAEEKVHAERRFSDSMIESMPGMLFMYNKQGRFLRWNRNFEKLSGFSEREIAGMTAMEFVPSDFRALINERIAEVFEKGSSSFEAPFQSRTGETVPYFFTGKRVFMEGVECLVGTGIDISERIEAERALKLSEQRLRSTMDCILEGCQLLDFDWTYLYLNDAAAVHNRRPNSDLLGKRMQESWPGIDRTRVFDQIRRCMEKRIPFCEETAFTFPDGTTGWFAVSGQPVPEGVFILSIDVTERHKAEAALRELNEELECKVAERTEELRTALVRAEAADRLKSAFLATMSHELRTPLNSIIGFSGILLQGLAGELNAEQSKQLGMVRSSARHLLDLINDVLDLSKIEAGQLEMRCASFLLKDSLERALAIVKPLAEAKGLGLNWEMDHDLGEMMGDQRRVEQILLNLLNNAIKFTDSGTVGLSALLVHDDVRPPGAPWVPAVRIDVVDTGIGMRQEDQGSLFRPFRQIDCGLTRSHEGTGLGLAICRRLAKLMHGDIQVVSEWGKGSRFTVTLPMTPIASHEPHHPAD